MLTYEKVLKVFADLLAKDPDIEVVSTSRGYTVLWWDDMQNEWFNAKLSPKPQDLLEELLSAYSIFQEDALTGSDRDLTEQEEKELQKQKKTLKQKCLAD